MHNPPQGIIKFEQDPLKRATRRGGQVAIVCFLGLCLLIYLLLEQDWTRSPWVLRQTNPTLKSIISVAHSIAPALLIPSAFGLMLALPLLVSTILARRDLKVAIAAETDPARLAVLKNMDSCCRVSLRLTSARSPGYIGVQDLLRALPQLRPLILTLGVKLPHEESTPPPPTAPGEEINLLELRQHPRGSKFKWVNVILDIWATLWLGGAIFIYFLMRREALQTGTTLPPGTFLMILAMASFPVIFSILPLILTRTATMNSAMLTPGRLEDYRFYRRFSPFNRARHQSGVLTFTPQDSILILSQFSKRRRTGTFIRRDGACVGYQLIADDKIDPLAEVLDRWRA